MKMHYDNVKILKSNVFSSITTNFC